MQTDEDFNIKFVNIVKKHKCIYDKKVPEYRNKDEQEKSWIEIAQETRESVSHCKERWRNLRACLSRYIKQQNSADAQHKPYYLTEHMQFLLPFLKSHRQSVLGCHYGYDLHTNIMDIKNSDQDDDTNENDFTEIPKFPIQTPKHRLSETDTTSVNCVPDVHVEIEQTETEPEVLFMTGTERIPDDDRKRIKLENNNSYNDNNSDMDFFRSVLPDIQGMNALQKRKFKIGILELIDDVYIKFPEKRPIPIPDGNGFWRKS